MSRNDARAPTRGSYTRALLGAIPARLVFC
jgi:hypothetical protein